MVSGHVDARGSTGTSRTVSSASAASPVGRSRGPANQVQTVGPGRPSRPSPPEPRCSSAAGRWLARGRHRSRRGGLGAGVLAHLVWQQLRSPDPWEAVRPRFAATRSTPGWSTSQPDNREVAHRPGRGHAQRGVAGCARPESSPGTTRYGSGRRQPCSTSIPDGLRRPRYSARLDRSRAKGDDRAGRAAE